MDRRSWFEAACAAVCSVAWSSARAQPDTAVPSNLRSLAVLDFELVDDQDNPLTKAAQEVRLRKATRAASAGTGGAEAVPGDRPGAFPGAVA